MKGKSPLFIYHPRYVSGDIAFKSGKLDFFDYISRRNDVDANGVLDIVAHGGADCIQISHNGENIKIDSRMLAKLIRKNAQYKSQGIRLLSCNTGSLPNGFAQNLANKLGVPVSAPNKLLWSDETGKYHVAGRSRINKMRPSSIDVGEFITFYPGGNKR